MSQVSYYQMNRRPVARRSRKPWWYGVIALVVLLAGFGVYKYFFAPTPVEKAVDSLAFAASASPAERQAVRAAMQKQAVTYRGSVQVAVQTTEAPAKSSLVLAAYVPVTNVYAVKQSITKAELRSANLAVLSGTDSATRAALASFVGQAPSRLTTLTSLDNLSDSTIALIPADKLSFNVKLLTFDNAYYLDSFTKGAVFRQAVFSGSGASSLSSLQLNSYASKSGTLKVNMTGVTALTRVMMQKLSSVKDPKYFSRLIGSFLADADITHVSNEVSFKPGCQYHVSAFCAPPQMIDVLKSSGVDLVELTGNHNNDTGNQYNTDSINLYHSLGWHTMGGGLNEVEGAKPYIANQKQSRVAFLGYNYADAPLSGAIATATTAGANHFDFAKLETDIAAAHRQADFVIVDVQFWECYAYPNGFVEFPECDVPIPTQEDVFRRIVDLGADMVVGTQAHQPQTYEIYKDKPIYYGLGNLYFEQTTWPGTERGIILTHYFVHGKLIQTKLTPTIYDKALQTHIMNSAQATYLLQRLKTARQTAGL